MKKRILSVTLTALLLAGLWVPAAAESGADLTEKAWDVALDLNEASGVLADCSVELDGDVAAGGYTGTVHASMIHSQAALTDGSKEAVTETTVYLPDDGSYEMTVVDIPGQGALYLFPAEDGSSQIERYESAPADTFGDLSVLALHFAALGDDMLGAVPGEGNSLTYTLAGDELKDLVTGCCPLLADGLDGLDWSAVTAEAETDLTAKTIRITSPTLGQAVLASMENVETVENAQLTLKITVRTISDPVDTASLPDQMAEQAGASITDMTGEGYAPQSMTSVIWAACEPGWSEVNGRESSKDALRAALTGGTETAADAEAGEESAD